MAKGKFLLFALAIFPATAAAAPELESLPLVAPSADMMAMAAAQTPPTVTLFYVATAVDAIGRESIFSSEASATLLSTSTSVVLTWTASPSDIVGYNVYRGTKTGGPYTKQNTTGLVSAVTYTDPFPIPGAVSGLTATVH